MRRQKRAEGPICRGSLCDGIEVWRGSAAPLNGSTHYASSPAVFNPPLVFPPGVLMEIYLDSPLDIANKLTLTGYFLTPEDLGK